MGMNPMMMRMNPMMMGHMGHHGMHGMHHGMNPMMMGMHPGMMGMGMGMQQPQHPLVQINDMSKRGHADSDSADGRRRRLTEQSDDDDEDGKDMDVTTIKKCLQLDEVDVGVGVVCMSQTME